MPPRSSSFFNRPPLQVARSLLGDVLVRTLPTGERRRGRITETEAYLGPHDLASHTARGRTARNEVMFGEPGLAYVYFVYGMHFCVNAVTGQGAAVLIRALEPLDGFAARLDGPARLTKALSIDKALNGVSLSSPQSVLIIEPGTPVPAKDVIRGPRVGLGPCGAWADKPYRFRIKKGTSFEA